VGVTNPDVEVRGRFGVKVEVRGHLRMLSNAFVVKCDGAWEDLW